MGKPLKTIYPPVLLAAVILLLWEGGVRLAHLETWILPAPSEILRALWVNRSLMVQHMKPTLLETLAGLAAGTAAAIVLACVIQLSDWLRRALYPLLVGTQTVPIVAVAPLFIIWFGYGFFPKLLVVMLVTFFPVTVSLVEGLSSADADLVRLLRSIGAGKWRIFRTVRFPHALPYLFSGLKIAATYSVLGAVVAEWLGASNGLGVYLIRAQNAFAADEVFAVIVVITFYSVFLFVAVQVAARLIAPWAYRREREDEQAKGEMK
ncbi:MAG TPA: ABC transporter permease [Bacillales bacterium]|nr:ABC transporter permease [Bacillales bacterium]